jgi:hypothetical protein
MSPDGLGVKSPLIQRAPNLATLYRVYLRHSFYQFSTLCDAYSGYVFNLLSPLISENTL